MASLTTSYRSAFIPPPVTSKKQVTFAENDNTFKKFESSPVCDSCKKLLTIDELKNEFNASGVTTATTNSSLHTTSDNSNDNKSELSPGCSGYSQNRYLDTLLRCFPDLYQRLEKIPNPELLRRLEIERLRTTYQKYFCKLPQYPNGIYQSMEQEEDKIKNKCLSMKKDGCSQFNCDVIRTREIKAIVNQPKTEYKICVSVHTGGPKCHNPPGGSGRQETKGHNTTEYRDVIGRTGCIIKQNRIHNHHKCKFPKGCIHVLKKTCRTYS